MKRAKLVLSAVAILAVVGGALAFKARGTSQFFTATSSTAPCTVLANLPYSTTTTDLTQQPVAIRASIQSTTATCPVLNVYTIE